jgi:hypothetical protein
MALLNKIAFGLASIFSGLAAKSQPAELNLETYRKEQNKLQRTGMYVLSGWAGANIISGAYFSGRTEGSTKYFHRMNMYWNAVNGVIAGAALYRLSKNKNKPATFADINKQQQSLEKTLLFNAGLDVAYITAGALLVEKSKNSIEKQSRYKGFGNSVIMQGGFLLLFDGVLYSLLHHKGKKLEKVLEKVQVAPAANGVSVVVNL